MPAYSTLKTFVRALRTGETNITKKLTEALAAEGTALITEQESVDPDLSEDLKELFANYGMKPEEIAHIENEWDGPLRNEVRVWILNAYGASPAQPVTFSWALFDGEGPENDRVDPGGADPVSVTFLSPRKGVKLSWLNYGDISVDR